MRHIWFLFLMLLPASFAYGQEIIVRTIDSATFVEADTNGVTLEAPYILTGVPTDEMSMLNASQYLDELEMVDEQREQLRELQKTISEMNRKSFESIQELGRKDPTEFVAKMKETQAKIKELKKSKLNEILLPHQVKRLQELKLQQELRNRGTHALSAMKEALGLTDEQIEKMRTKQRESDREVEKQVAKIKFEARQKLLREVLTAEQRKKLQEMMGSKYEVKQREEFRRIAEQLKE